MCFVFHHDQFEGHKLHRIQKWSKVTTEGDLDHFFPLETFAAVPNQEEGATEVKVPAIEGLEYDIEYLHTDGEPFAQNTPAEVASGGHVMYGYWGFFGICQRCA
jgi:hypothetical protein